MTLLQAILIAIVQGITEFLPVSSSGHMVLAEAVLGVHPPGVLWEVALHVGTLLAVLAVFRREIWETLAGFTSGLGQVLHSRSIAVPWEGNTGFRMGCYVLIGTVPAVIAGLTLRGWIQGLFSCPILSAAMIFVTGEVLWLSRPHSLVRPSGKVKALDSLAVGLAQAAALVPGISRSGATISAGLLRGIDRDRAVRFSFLLSVPAILGAAALEASKLNGLPAEQAGPMIAGIAVAAVSGFFALRFLLRVVKAGKLHFFSYYCWAMGIVGIALLWPTAHPG